MQLNKIKGIGPKKEKLLNKLDIYSVEDLLNYFPRDYEDRTTVKKLNTCVHGEKSLLKLKIISNLNTRYLKNNMSITTCLCADETGKCKVTWFNQPYLKNILYKDNFYYFYGEVNFFNFNIDLKTPIVEKTLNGNLGKIVPIYPLTEGLSNNDISKFIKQAIKHIDKLDIKDIIPQPIKSRYKLLNKKSAIINIHYPQNRSFFALAKKTIIFEELLIMQTYILLKNNYSNKKDGIKYKIDKRVYEFIDNLPFKLTNAQANVLDEIFNDMKSDKSMNRLVQGDVGSGKTIVALIALLLSYYNGYQCAFMAPTEILATQHYQSIVELFKDLNINVALLKGSLKESEKKEIKADLEKDNIDILVGTHSILEDDVIFNNLGLVITDEQHRFGVKQRAKISSKGNNPDTLVMTATPIPRTLSLVLYGDLDISIIDELPPGRTKVDTYAVNSSMEKRIMNFVKKQINSGRQVYIVCPLVEESETMNLNSVEELYIRLKTQYFKDYPISFIHGKMKPKEKDEIMDNFLKNNIKILLSTTVIEVGVNVVNANTMIVYNAERFGLSQLHQLRGRVGRGKHKSYCILINDNNSKISRQRMRIMQSSNDGFYIAEKDLELRGSGDMFGTRQSGVSKLEVLGMQDSILIERIQKISKYIIENNYLDKDREFLNLKNSIIDYDNKINDEIILN